MSIKSDLARMPESTEYGRLGAYEKIHEYAQRTGGSNRDGRISKSFFGAVRAEGVARWVSRTAAQDAAVTSDSLSKLEFDTRGSSRQRHQNFDLSVPLVLEPESEFELSFAAQVLHAQTNAAVSVLASFMSVQRDPILTEKAAFQLSSRPEGHSLALVPPEGAAFVKLTINVNRELEFHAVVDNIQIAGAAPASSSLPTLPSSERKFRWRGTEDLSALDDEHIDIIAGCELSYFSAYLKSLGLRVRHSFELHGAMDPYAELISPDSAFRQGEARTAIFSQVQVLRPLISRIEVAGGTRPAEELRIELDALIEALDWSIRELRSSRSCKIWVTTHPGYHTPSLGWHDYRNEPGTWTVNEFLSHYRLAVYQLVKRHAQIYVLDVDLALEREGKQPSQGSARLRRHETLGGHLESDGAKIVAENFILQLLTTSKRVKRIKCVVVDCDNTLWNGVLREDGADKVRIERVRFQRLWHLGMRGIPIALCSKNDPADEPIAMEVIKRYGRLHSKVVCSRFGWGPKSEAIKSIAEELNIGLDTIAFFDDSPFERAEVSEALPGVSVFDATDIVDAPELPCFQVLGDHTAEGLTRVAKYKEEAVRAKAQQSFGADRFEDFLMNCQMRLEVRPAAQNELDRVVELLQRTNQMNATLRRFDAGIVAQYLQLPSRSVHVVKLGDKFGDYGIIGTALCALDGEALQIHELALSCRAMGRRVEDALIEELIGFAAGRGMKTIQIEVTRTSRNEQIIEVLHRCAFIPPVSGMPALGQVTMTIDLQATRRTGREFAKWFKLDDSIADAD